MRNPACWLTEVITRKPKRIIAETSRGGSSQARTMGLSQGSDWDVRKPWCFGHYPPIDELSSGFPVLGFSTCKTYQMYPFLWTLSDSSIGICANGSYPHHMNQLPYPVPRLVAVRAWVFPSCVVFEKFQRYTKHNSFFRYHRWWDADCHYCYSSGF